MGHFPHGGVGDHLLDHVGQIYLFDRFQRYDTNILRDTKGNEHKPDLNNYIRYGTKMPPETLFSAVGETEVPVHIFSA